ncbi:MAG: TIGR01906 family membrane protein [Chloroflexi bacterium]|nr:TIGR01906 family membrane protein [Chloroflexota bacterium]|tara:strand:+ start:30674 stop:31369 length:696 start_codon:yes stop_codon:yes gene_type:complete
MNKKISTSIKIFSSILWVPVTLCISLEIITFSDWVYEYNWTRNQISQNTGIKIDQLNQVSDQIKDYFRDDQEKLEVLLQQPGKEVFNLFNQKEIDHMVDVKNLIKTTILFERVGLTLLIIFFVFYLFREGYISFYENLKIIMLVSFLIWSILLFLIVFGMIVDFNYTFTLFHKIMFTNDLWILDPNSDFLIMIYPQRFFLEISAAIIILFILINIIIFLSFYSFRKFIYPR